MRLGEMGILWMAVMAASVVLFAGSVILFLNAIRSGRKNALQKKLGSPLNTLIMGAFLSLLVIFVVYHLVEKGEYVADALLIGCFNAVRVFLANEDISFLHEAIRNYIPFLTPIFSFYISFLYILSPILTLSFVLSFFCRLCSSGLSGK